METRTATAGLVSDDPWQRPADSVLLGIFFGLVTGAAEVISYFIRSFVLGRPFYFRGLNILWMVPVADVLLFGLPGLFITLAMTRWRGDKFARAVCIGFVGVATYVLLPNDFRLHWVARVLLSLGVGVQVGSLLSRHPHSLRRFVRMVTLPAICLVIVTALAFRATDLVTERRALANLRPPPTNASNVLVIVLDAVRAENLSVYGYGRSTTPNLERLAERSVVFDRAVSTAPWTLPSHASMFTGHYPHEMSADWEIPLDDTYPTLAERLRDRGYLTGAFFGNYFYGVPEYGLSRGFVHYESRRLNFSGVMGASRLGSYLVERFNGLTHSYNRPGRTNAAEINRILLNWLPEAGSRPFFALVNYFDAHQPYDPPAPYDLKFSVTEPPTRASMDKRLTEVETRGMRDAYDGAVAYVDWQLGVLFRELQRRGLLLNTLVIVTADHGDEFGEHGWIGHGNGLYFPVLHVPLLLYFPSHVPGGTRIAEPVTLRDLPATVVDLLGLSGEIEFPGRSLALHWGSASNSFRRPLSPLLSEVNRPRNVSAWYAVAKGDMQSIIVGRHHYIRNGDGREELFDLVADPWEMTDLAPSTENRAILEAARAALKSALGDSPRAPAAAPSQ